MGRTHRDRRAHPGPQARRRRRPGTLARRHGPRARRGRRYRRTAPPLGRCDRPCARTPRGRGVPARPRCERGPAARRGCRGGRTPASPRGGRRAPGRRHPVRDHPLCAGLVEPGGRTNVQYVPCAEILAHLAQHPADGTVTVAVQQTYALAEAAEALRAPATRHTGGKLALRVA
ncbi:zinc-binding dehydrogenase [Streptomyces sp. NPDC048420]|uniref:zinc-binding dehydrogenase n=1 Tax=Streptomyces sp. NPDC048420 TaxID=3155755 RepID=UPI00342D16B9